MISLFFKQIISTDEKLIFKKVYNDKIISLDVSGNSKQYINGSMQLTKPEYAIYPWDKRYDWCSNCIYDYKEYPYIIFSLIGRKFRFNGYLLRCGCCYDGCCCDDGYGCFDCCLYSWKLLISDDNINWNEVHKVEKDYEMIRCKEKSYKFEKTYTAKYIKLIQTANCPGYPACIAINKIDFYGDTLLTDVQAEANDDFVSFHDDDEDVSIIGHISKNGNVKFD